MLEASAALGLAAALVRALPAMAALVVGEEVVRPVADLVASVVAAAALVIAALTRVVLAASEAVEEEGKVLALSPPVPAALAWSF